MIAPSLVRDFPLVVVLSVFLSVPLLIGCGSGSDNDTPPDTSAVDQEEPSASEARRLASRYLSLSYKGASLRSTHPLTDSLLALRAGRGGGGPVVLVDTFTVDPASMSRTDSIYTVQTHIPHALTVSKGWETSNPRTEQTFTLRVNEGKVSGAPRIVGWSALRRHVVRVDPENGEDIVERLQKRWTDITGERAGV